MQITFVCGQCGQNIAIDDTDAGHSVKCPKCGASVSVPTADGAKTQTMRSNELPVSNGTIDPRKIAELEIGARVVRLRLHDGTELQWPNRGGISVMDGKLQDGLTLDWSCILEGTLRRKDGSEYTMRRCLACGKATDKIGLCASCENNSGLGGI